MIEIRSQDDQPELKSIEDFSPLNQEVDSNNKVEHTFQY